MDDAQSRRDELATMVERGGEIPHFAWPGGYPMVYYPHNAPGEDLCGECAEAERREAVESGDEEYRLPLWDYLPGSEEDHGVVACYNCGRILVPADEGEE